jgi:hypothetical protein
MQQLENKLDELLVKKAPFHLPDNAKQGLVKVLPWLVLLLGALMFISAWGAFQAATYVDRWSSIVNEFSAAYGVGSSVNPVITPLLWISLFILLAEAILYFVSYPSLEKREKKGWNILFWVALANIVQVIVNSVAYSNAYLNIGAALFSVLGSVAGLYILFQIRAYYTGEKKLTPAAVTSPTMKVPKETPVEKPAVKPADDTAPKA